MTQSVPTAGLAMNKMASSRVKARVNYPDLDIVKLLMAFLVVEIHTRPLEAFAVPEKIIEGIDVIAVPFFFIASAFLCFRGLSEKDFGDASSRASCRVRKTALKLLELYAIWTVLYLPITIFGDLLYGKSLLSCIVSFVHRSLLVGENFCSWPLWYLLAGAVAFALVYLCLRGGVASKLMIGISFVILLVGYLITCAAAWDSAPSFVSVPVGIYEKLFVNTRNGFFEGFFYVAVGAVLGMRHERLDSIPLGWLVGCFCFGIVGCIFVNADAHLPFCALAGISLFMLSIRRHGSELGAHTGARNASTIIYLVHMIFAVLFVYAICGGSNPDIHANDADRLSLYLFTLICSGALSALVVRLSEKAPFLKRVFGI